MWFDPTRGSARALLRVLKDFAAQSGHPEIETVPWALWGHSGGGIWSDRLSTLYPERVVGMWLRSGSVPNSAPPGVYPTGKSRSVR